MICIELEAGFDDHAVSVEGLDTLVAMLQSVPGIFGARLTGAEFSGACVALIDTSAQLKFL